MDIAHQTELNRCQALGYFDDADESPPEPSPTFLFAWLAPELEDKIVKRSDDIKKHNNHMKRVVSQINRFQPDFYTTWYFNDCDNQQLTWINNAWRDNCQDEDEEYIPFKNLGEAWESTHYWNNGHGWGWCYVECIAQTVYDDEVVGVRCGYRCGPE